MGEAYFYHLTRQPTDAVLSALLPRALGAGWRVVVRGTSADHLDTLDEKLWLSDGFLPHGRAGGDFDADQPVLLTEGAELAECLVSIDSAEISADEITASKRTMILFDGNDGEALTVARSQWKALTGAGVAAKYWSQESGKWEMKAQSG